MIITVTSIYNGNKKGVKPTLNSRTDFIYNKLNTPCSNIIYYCLLAGKNLTRSGVRILTLWRRKLEITESGNPRKLRTKLGLDRGLRITAESGNVSLSRVRYACLNRNFFFTRKCASAFTARTLNFPNGAFSFTFVCFMFHMLPS